MIKNHPFSDGNKRAAFHCTIIFLFLNGILISAEDNKSSADFFIRVGTGEIEGNDENERVANIAKWLKEHSETFEITD